MRSDKAANGRHHHPTFSGKQVVGVQPAAGRLRHEAGGCAGGFHRHLETGNYLDELFCAA